MSAIPRILRADDPVLEEFVTRLIETLDFRGRPPFQNSPGEIRIKLVVVGPNLRRWEIEHIEVGTPRRREDPRPVVVPGKDTP